MPQTDGVASTSTIEPVTPPAVDLVVSGVVAVLVSDTVPFFGSGPAERAMQECFADEAGVSPHGTQVVLEQQLDAPGEVNIRFWFVDLADEAAVGIVTDEIACTVPVGCHAFRVACNTKLREHEVAASILEVEGVVLDVGHLMEMPTTIPGEEAVIKKEFEPVFVEDLQEGAGDDDSKRDNFHLMYHLEATDELHAVAFSSDGRHVATGGDDRMVRVYSIQVSGAPQEQGEMTTPELEHAFGDAASTIEAIAFSNDGRFLAAGGQDHVVRVYDFISERSDRLRFALTGAESGVLSIAFSPDSRLIAAAGGDAQVRIYDLARALHVSIPSCTVSGGEAQVEAIAFSSDGRYLATGGLDSQVRIYSIVDVDASLHLELPVPNRCINSLEFSHDSRFLAAGGCQAQQRVAQGMRSVIIFDVDNHSTLSSSYLETEAEEVQSVAFSPNAELFAAGGDHGVINVYSGSASSMSLLYSLEEPSGIVYALAFSRCWLAAAGSDHRVRLYGYSDCTVFKDQPDSTIPLEIVPASHDPEAPEVGQAEAREVEVEVEDYEEAEEEPGDVAQRVAFELVLNFTASAHTISSVALSRDGRFAATSGSDDAVRLYDLQNAGHLLGTLTDPSDSIYSVAISGDGKRLAAAGEDHTVHVWDIWDIEGGELVSGATPAFRAHFPGAVGRVWTVAFSPDARYLAVGGDNRLVIVYDLDSEDTEQQTPLVERIIDDAQSGVYSVTFSQDGNRLAVGGHDGVVRVYNFTEAHAPALLAGRSLRPSRARSPRVSFSVVSDYGTNRTIEKDNQSSTHTMQEIFSVALSPDGCFLATGGTDRIIRMYDLEQAPEPVLVKRFADVEAEVLSVAFSTHGRYLAATAGRKVHVYELGSDDSVELNASAVQNEASPRHLKYILDEAAGDVVSVAFGGCKLATGGEDRHVRLYDFCGGEAPVLAPDSPPSGEPHGEKSGGDKTGMSRNAQAVRTFWPVAGAAAVLLCGVIGFYHFARVDQNDNESIADDDDFTRSRRSDFAMGTLEMTPKAPAHWSVDADHYDLLHSARSSPP